uniref:Uncharacterized protein n=1 Tax=Aegilops tauschii subsp. strangulata TaxID=200361 RepID=A0A453BIF2_AEGTS
EEMKNYLSLWISAVDQMLNLGTMIVFLYAACLMTFSDASNIVESNYGFSVVDANSLEFVFNNAPEAAKWLKDNSELSLKEKYRSDRSTWVVSKFSRKH